MTAGPFLIAIARMSSLIQTRRFVAGDHHPKLLGVLYNQPHGDLRIVHYTHRGSKLITQRTRHAESRGPAPNQTRGGPKVSLLDLTHTTPPQDSSSPALSWDGSGSLLRASTLTIFPSSLTKAQPHASRPRSQCRSSHAPSRSRNRSTRSRPSRSSRLFRSELVLWKV